MANKGILYGISAYLIWGFYPIYFKLIQNVPAVEILFHRVVWCFLFLALVMLIRHDWTDLKARMNAPIAWVIYLVAAVLLGVNWLTYVWGVNSGFIVETSLGYFINPLLSVLLGVLFLREKLRPMQWLPIGMAAVAVLYLTLQYGRLPWIALVLAFSFGLYGLVKKISPLGAVHGLAVEMSILFVPALIYLLLAASRGSGSFGQAGLSTSVLLLLSGVVTALPLLLFATAVRRIPLSLVGILQYIAPTCQFLIGVLLYGEAMTPARLVGFIVIWLALLLLWMEGWQARRRALELARSATA